MEKGSTISTKRTGLRKTPERGREKRREREIEREITRTREREMMIRDDISYEE